jgi:hypothetical protein
MGRFHRLVTLFVLLVIAFVPLSALADATPEATPAEHCAFPPISVDLLREFRDEIATNPPPTPTPEARLQSPRTHLMPFPPPPGEPIDDATVASVRAFLDDYAACMRAGGLLFMYGAWTEDLIRRSLGSNPETADAVIRAVEMESAGTPVFVYPGTSLPLLRAWRIETSHVVAVVQIVGAQQYWTMLLLPHGDSWRIDDLWSASPPMIGDSLTGPVYATPIPNP